MPIRNSDFAGAILAFLVAAAIGVLATACTRPIESLDIVPARAELQVGEHVDVHVAAFARGGDPVDNAVIIGWSSDTEVATVDTKLWRVHAHQPGETRIFAEAPSGGVVTSLLVTVVGRPAPDVGYVQGDEMAEDDEGFDPDELMEDELAAEDEPAREVETQGAAAEPEWLAEEDPDWAP